MWGKSDILLLLVLLNHAGLASSIGTRSLRDGTRFETSSTAQLSTEDLKGCSFEIVMFDTRDLVDVPVFDGKLMPDLHHYQSLTAVINYAYAHKFGYKFNFVSMDKANMNPNFSIPWHRVFYFADRLNTLKEQAGCTWLMYVDTDAFMHDFTTSLDSFISSLSSKYNIDKDVGAIFAQEQTTPLMTQTYHEVNAGVYLVQSNEQSRRLFDTWSAAASDDIDLEKAWPAEQGVLTELLFPGKYMTRMGELLPDGQHKAASARLGQHDDVASSVAVVNMTEMNSPWGWFVEHIWSGPGSEKRGTDYTDMLDRIDATDPHMFSYLLHSARKHMSSWYPPPTR